MKVILSSGHITDKPGRLQPRFPESNVDPVRDLMVNQLDDWDIGPGDLAICGGARGSDILFAEISADRGANVWLFTSLDEQNFLEESVRVHDTPWEKRWLDLRKRPRVKTFWLQEQTASPFAATNDWMITTGKKEAKDPNYLYAIVVWDGKDTGDGPGGTTHFVKEMMKHRAHLAIIHPMTLVKLIGTDDKNG